MGYLGLILIYFGIVAITKATEAGVDTPVLGLASIAAAGLCGWFVIAHIIIGAFKIKSGDPVVLGQEVS